MSLIKVLLKKSFFVLTILITLLISFVGSISPGFAEPVSFFDTDLTTGKDRFKQVVRDANGGSTDFYEMDIDSALSSNVFSVSNGAGDTAWVRVTQNGSSVLFDEEEDGTGYYHTWSVNSEMGGVPDWDTAVANGIHFEFFSDSGLNNKLFVNAFGTHTYHWGTCCIDPNPIPPDPDTGDPRTLVGTAIFTIFDADPERYDEMVGNITEEISPDTHFVGEIDDRDSSFAEITLIPNGNGEQFGVGGYIIFSTVPEGSVPPGAGSTPSIPPGNPDLTAATDLGDSSTDDFTSDTTPDFEITYTPQNEIDFVNLYSGPSSTGPWTLIATSAAAGTTSETTVTLTSSTLAEGSYYIMGRVENGYWHDESDPSPTPLYVTIDSTSPTVTITAAEISNGESSNHSSLSLTFSSSESTSTFDAGDINVTNGSLSGFSGSGDTYTAALTPDGDGPVTVNVLSGSYMDEAGNDNLAADEFNWTSDQTPPTVEFNPKNNETIVANEADIILTLSEAIQRASDGADLNNTNIDAHITLKYDNSSGLDVPFDASIDAADRVITVDPDSALLSNQAYYVAMGTSVEDHAGNPLADDSAIFMSADETLPTLSSSNPSDGLTGVDVDTDLELNFSEPVWGQSGGAIEIRRLSDDSLFESIDVTGGQISGDGTENITVDISGPLESLTDYYVLISNTSYDDFDGNPYAGINTPTKLNFTTEYVDMTPPVVTITPADGASNVSVSSNVSISFDEPVRNLDDSPLTDSIVDSLITLKDTDAGGADIPFDATIDGAKEVITITPDSNFASEQVVYVAIGASVEDESDNAISAANGTFTVEDILPPTLLSTIPGDDAVNVGINDNLTMTFDEPVDVEFGTVTIYRSSDDSIFESMSVTSATQVSGGGTDTITINPANTMGYSTSYYVQVDSTAFDDAAGNSYAGIADSTTWNFTTAPENEPPTAVDDSASTDEDSVVTIDALSNDSDPDAGDVLSVTDVDTTGTTGLVVDNGDGTFDYDPDGQYEDLAQGEISTDSFGYTISDGNGGSDTAAVTVTINGVNDAPSISTCEIIPDPAYTDDDLTASYTGWDDPEGDPANVLYEWYRNGSHLSAYSGSGTLPSGELSKGDDIELNCSPVDGEGLAGTGLTDNITISNSPPAAQDDADSTPEDTSITIDVLDNDSDADSGDTLTIISVTQGSDGSVTNNNTDVTYTPDSNFFGTDSFEYTVEDDDGETDSAVVTVTVSEETNMEASGNGQSITNGDTTPSTTDHTDFGNTSLFPGTVTRTFTITNQGSIDLRMTGSPRVEITGSHAGDFTVTDQPSTPLTSGSSTTFDIAFDPSAAGLREAVINIETDDLTSAFTFHIQGTATENDSDSDGMMDNQEQDGDRDGDGVADYQDYDPSGYFYDERNGKIVSGGSVAVTGPGVINIVEDGSSGYYQFLTDGTAGIYTMTVNLPPRYAWSTACFQSDPPAFDPTGQAEPVSLGNGEDGSTGFLTSNACTTFYLTFDLEADDPMIINNNFPLRKLPLPDTGFAPDRVTELPQQPDIRSYLQIGGMVLEIPMIDVETSLVGVPAVNGEWDVSWLGNQAGYLEGSAFPTWVGNTVITGHVWNANNQPGVFVDLKKLSYGDEIRIHAWGNVYIYQVQSSQLLSPYVTDPVMEHKEKDWLTLFTCEDFAEFWGEYAYRRVVQAVLVEVRQGD